MAKYYKFSYNAGHDRGNTEEEIYKFRDDVKEATVREAFNDWYDCQREDYGDYEEISEAEAEESGEYIEEY